MALVPQFSRSLTLGARCQLAFPATSQSRGAEYFLQERVSLPVILNQSATFIVQGTERYKVTVHWEMAKFLGEIGVLCSCAHFEGGELCKHAWASFLKLDDEGIGRDIPSGPTQTDLEVIHEGFPSTTPTLPASWRTQLQDIQKPSRPVALPRIAYYVLDLAASLTTGLPAIELYYQVALGSLKRGKLLLEDLRLYPNASDRELLAVLLTSAQAQAGVAGSYGQATFSRTTVPIELQESFLPRLAQSTRLVMQPRKGDSLHQAPIPILWDDGAPYTLELEIGKEEHQFRIEGFLKRGDERISVRDPLACFLSGILIFRDRMARLDPANFAWIVTLRRDEPFLVPESEGDALVEALQGDPSSPPVIWPELLQWEQVRPTPAPRVLFSPLSASRSLQLKLEFDYLGHGVSRDMERPSFLDIGSRRIIHRAPEAELAGQEKLQELLATLDSVSASTLRVPVEGFPDIASKILSWGWGVQAHGKKVRTPLKLELGVSSGLDWFELRGAAEFDNGQSVALPSLLDSLKKGIGWVTLKDGSLGILPEEWLKRYSKLASLGTPAEAAVRFSRAQGALLAGWFADDPQLQVDTGFEELQERLKSLEKLVPRSPPKTFKGQLRPYQKLGLAWLEMLRETGLGGVLADDMGLGKTVQVLAHLEAERLRVKPLEHLPSLIILPKSLLFNWQEESARFTPSLKVVAYTGTDRQRLLAELPTADLVLTTYSTLRQDLEPLKQMNFHYVIADEAQFIKNPSALAHQAALKIPARHRLALTGTPVENSLDDLFAIFGFSSPGLLGSRARERLSKAAANGAPDPEAFTPLARALRPFILRRTKGEVLKQLPEKQEMILHCELGTQERKFYDELKNHYRLTLQGEIERKGLARSKIVVLEALLRLRQASCHPGLIDKSLADQGSSKTETLLAQLREVIAEGHKALVFSQFTSFLGIVRNQLDQENITYEYLDGKTPSDERQKRVHRFQNDPQSKLFLISLKAGGVGLNLTAADYVFILDPWWNPAVESQAVDRAHRIGQKNKVMAYRLIARDTVEEKIIELQKSKRALASAIVSADVNLLRGLTNEDLETLFS